MRPPEMSLACELNMRDLSTAMDVDPQELFVTRVEM